jgi:hypothetical protein
MIMADLAIFQVRIWVGVGYEKFDYALKTFLP